MQVVIGYTYIVANGSSCCFSSGCRNMEGFMRWASRLHHEMHKPSTISTGREMWTNFMHVKLWVWSTSTGSQNLLPKQTRSLLTKLIAQGEILETSAKLRVLVSNISSPRLKCLENEIFASFFILKYWSLWSAAKLANSSQNVQHSERGQNMEIYLVQLTSKGV